MRNQKSGTRCRLQLSKDRFYVPSKCPGSYPAFGWKSNGPVWIYTISGVNSKRAPSNNPRSLSLSSGMTSSAIKARVM